MFALQLIHNNGGSKTITGATPEECKERAKDVTEKLKGTFVAATVPYEVKKVYNGHLDALDVSIPQEIRQSLGADILKLYTQAE